MFAVFAAAASVSMSAPGSLGARRLMIDAKPSFLISGTASALVAPPHATVVSRRVKLIAPGTSCLVTCCAPAGRDPSSAIATKMRERRRTMESPLRNRRPIILRKAPLSPPGEKFPGAALRRHERREAEAEANRDDPVAAAY